MRILDQSVASYERGVAWGRQRFQTFDHVWAAKHRFEEVRGGRLASAISYYGFFAAFALAVVAYSILGRVFGATDSASTDSAATDGAFVTVVNGYLQDTLPWVLGTAEQVGQNEFTVIGSIALIFAGVGWVEELRSSLRAMWLLTEDPGNWIIRKLIDLGMLIGLGVLLALSLAMTAAIDRVLEWFAPDTTFGNTLIRSSGPVLELLVNVVVAAAMLAAVPRLHLSPRRLIPPALVVAVGIQLLNSVGRWFIARSEDRPAYQVVAGAVGLLIYLYLVNQLILFGAALSATSTAGRAVDLAAATATGGDQKVGDPADHPASRAVGRDLSRDDERRSANPADK